MKRAITTASGVTYTFNDDEEDPGAVAEAMMLRGFIIIPAGTPYRTAGANADTGTLNQDRAILLAQVESID